MTELEKVLAGLLRQFNGCLSTPGSPFTIHASVDRTAKYLAPHIERALGKVHIAVYLDPDQANAVESFTESLREALNDD